MGRTSYVALIVFIISIINTRANLIYADDRNLVSHVQEQYFSSISPTDLSNFLATSNHRLTTLRHVPSTGQFAATTVPNSGDYEVEGWYWYYGINFHQVGHFIDQNNGRLIDIDTYNDGQTYAIVMVVNTGPQQKGWYWYSGINFAKVSSLASQMRFQRLHRYKDAFGNVLFSVIGVFDSGVDSYAWWWYTGISVEALSSELSFNNARLNGLQVDWDGSVTALTVSDPQAPTWWWYYGIHASQIQHFVATTGSRIIDLTPEGGSDLYSIVLIGN